MLFMQITQSNKLLYKYLNRLNSKQLKAFYAIFINCRSRGYSFISNRNFFNLWCELNYLCHIADEGFPVPYNDHKLLKSFCEQYPFYFIDRLSTEVIAKHFAEHCDENTDVLTELTKVLCKRDYKSVQQYISDNFKLEQTVDKLVSDLENHIEPYTYD